LKRNHNKSLAKIEHQIRKQEGYYKEHQNKMEDKYSDFVKELQTKGKSTEANFGKLQKDCESSKSELEIANMKVGELLRGKKEVDKVVEGLVKGLGLCLGAICGLISQNCCLLNERVVQRVLE